jgi:hypothetical protein
VVQYEKGKVETHAKKMDKYLQIYARGVPYDLSGDFGDSGDSGDSDDSMTLTRLTRGLSGVRVLSLMPFGSI